MDNTIRLLWSLCLGSMHKHYTDPACGLLICVGSKDYNKHQPINNVLTTRPDHVFSKGCRFMASMLHCYFHSKGLKVADLWHQCYTVLSKCFPDATSRIMKQVKYQSRIRYIQQSWALDNAMNRTNKLERSSWNAMCV